jgi:7,8-dihydro-6-hydroxymethylpterin-pyrophosphokinase
VGGPAGQSPFLNAAVLIDTPLAPERLLDEVGKIERDLGRRRTEHWGPRPIDLDLLFYDDLVVASNRLQLPHPRMAWRRFVLAPSVEVAPTMRHPTIGWTVRQLLDHLDTATAYIAIAGPAGAGRAGLARAVAAQLGGKLITDPVSPDARRSDQDKSYGFGVDAEIEFAKRRAEILHVHSPMWMEGCPFWISDFWLGQSAANLWALSDESRRDSLIERWRHVTRHACPPKLTVLLDAPGETTIEPIRRFLSGPVLELDGRQPANALEELAAAVLAMES